MKNTYVSTISRTLRPRIWTLLLILVALPILGWAQDSKIIVNPNFTNFRSVPVNTPSTAAKIQVDAEDLGTTPITVSVRDFDGTYEISLNNRDFISGPLTLNLKTAKNGSFNDAVYIRFFPKEGGTVTDYVDFDSEGEHAEVLVTGTGVAPTITPAATNIFFENVTVNTSSTKSLSISYRNTQGNLTLNVPSGSNFLLSYAGGTPASTVIIPTTSSATLVSRSVDVIFTPTATVSYSSTLQITSPNATTQVVTLNGAGVPQPILTVSATTLPDFGAVVVGQTSFTQSFEVKGSFLQSPVTITTPANGAFQIRTGSTAFSTGTITLNPSTAGSIDATIDVIFAPTATGAISGIIAIASSGVASAQVQVSGTGTEVGQPAIVASPTLLDFGTVSSNGSANTLTFTLSATGLTEDLVLTPSFITSGGEEIRNIEFRDTSVPSLFQNRPLTIKQVNGNIQTRTIEVNLAGTIAAGKFRGSLVLSSSGKQTVVAIEANSTGNQSVIVTSPGAFSQFTTVPNVPSAVQSYQLSGQNLLQPITVTAPLLFQVSKFADFSDLTDSKATGNSITFAPNRGNDLTPAVNVYVRFYPTTATTVSDGVRNTSAPATGTSIPVSATSVPSIQTADVALIKQVVIYTSKDASTPITVRASRVQRDITLSVAQSPNSFNPNRTPQYQLSLDGKTFGSTVVLRPNLDPNSAAVYTVNQAVYVRYNPTYLGVADAALQYQSGDFAVQTAQSFTANGLITGQSIATEPAQILVAAQQSITRSADGKSATVTFNPVPERNGTSSYGEGRLIVASENGTLTNAPASQPNDGEGYETANGVYNGQNQGTIAPGFYTVFAGTAVPSTTITGLDPYKTYYFYVYGYNNIDPTQNISVTGAENYLTPTTPTTLVGIESVGLPPIILPVELVSFTANLQNNKVNLGWVTASEKNNKGFEIQRSQDATSFTTILFKNGKGSTNNKSTYVAVDEQPLSGVSYYRLKQIDNDGKISLSGIVTITNTELAEVTMYPNPTHGVLNIRLPYTSKAEVQVTITDLSGRVVRTEKLAANGEVSMNSLNNGTYLVTVNDGVKKITRRIVKN
ncbi:T9SS type A sorting domain-containing protein [Hymenobacter sp. BT188]|uniref:T9SS type A sorting domain-containing protein n=1 Tax=Hymenobacter sp. BT188 TaxID=2763504 RepID=UPI0016517530|nr:T9SS type A sorting domain-containing protein [Hymenobacter sp. BT188]MBC6605333.1 T9SS type A sorting domain-containing protein [Hymenobacter sp. BT188]